MMKLRRCALCRIVKGSASSLCSVLSIPLFWFCLLTAVAPGMLLGCLLGWKALFFPAAMPGFVRMLFLPLWLLLSCAAPAVCASAVLSARRGICIGQTTTVTAICTMQLLLSFFWALCLLYCMPVFFCVLSCAVCAVSALLLVRYLWRWYPILGMLMLISGIWNALLVFLCADF